VNSGPVGFGVLGPLQMTVGDTPVPLGSRKQRAVLAMLVIVAIEWWAAKC
jgi:SARP family transcriptional regulator, regulator of embCAB operon